MAMKKNSVNIAEFKAKMGKYLKKIRSGEDLILKDRNVEFARIVSLSAGQSLLFFVTAQRSVKDFISFVPPKVEIEGTNSLEILKALRKDRF